MDEREMHDVLANGIGHEPPVVGGPEAVFAGARVKVVRTRVMTGALSVAAVLGVAAGAVALGGGSGAGHGAAAQIVGPAAGATTATTAPTVGPTATAANGAAQATSGDTHGKGTTFHPAPAPGPGQVLIDGRTAADLLKQMLPAGLVTSHYGGQDSYLPQQAGVEVYGSMAIDDGHGPVTIGVNVQQNMSSLRVDHCSGDCTQLPDGSQLTVRVIPGKSTAPGAEDWQVDRVFPDGHRVVIQISNYFDDFSKPHDKGWMPPAVGPDPAVSIDRLKGIVGDPRWTLTVPQSEAAQAKQDLPGYNDLTQKDAPSPKH